MMQTAGERLALRGSGTVRLPVSGELVKFRIPRNAALIRAGLYPLSLTSIDTTGDPAEVEAAFEVADKSMARLICAACYEPAFIEGEPRAGRNECSVNGLCPEDFAELGHAIMDMLGRMYGEQPEPEPETEQEHDTMKAIALACARFGVDPTEAEEWPGWRMKRLLVYATLSTERNDGD